MCMSNFLNNPVNMEKFNIFIKLDKIKKHYKTGDKIKYNSMLLNGKVVN